MWTELTDWEKRSWISFNQEVILEKQKSDDGEHIDEDKSQDGSQDDRPAIPRHALNHVPKSVFAEDHV